MIFNHIGDINKCNFSQEICTIFHLPCKLFHNLSGCIKTIDLKFVAIHKRHNIRPRQGKWKQFEENGRHVVGLGEELSELQENPIAHSWELPLASNGSEYGREKNLWLQLNT